MACIIEVKRYAAAKWQDGRYVSYITLNKIRVAYKHTRAYMYIHTLTHAATYEYGCLEATRNFASKTSSISLSNPIDIAAIF